MPVGPVVENLPTNPGDTGSIPGLGRSYMPPHSRAHVPPLLKPTHLHQRVAPASATKAHAQQQRPSTTKNKQMNNLKNKI